MIILLLVLNLTPYETTVKIAEMAKDEPTEYPDGTRIPENERFPTNSTEIAIEEMWELGYYASGIIAFVPLAAILGAVSISGEVSRYTVLLLLSKPTSRARLLLIKYVVYAGVLLATALLGSVLLVVVAATREYPLSHLSIVGIVLSDMLLWLGSLSVLGVAILMSVVFRSVIGSVLATTLAVYLMFVLPGPFMDRSLWTEYHTFGISEELVWRHTLPYYWTNENLYMGGTFAATNFLACLFAAALPLLAALWLFNRKAY
jgi:ABC-type transport system involved in multi-copper enzyme maturation permease subunit